MAFECTKSAKPITFNFKFLHRRISTNNFLKKIGLVDSEKCTFCERETEELVHLFWACPKTQFFWTNFKVLNYWVNRFFSFLVIFAQGTSTLETKYHKHRVSTCSPVALKFTCMAVET